MKVKWSEVLAVGHNLLSISSQAGLQLLTVLVTLTLSHRSFNYDTGHGRVWLTLGDWHCGLETFMLGSRYEPMQSNIIACSTGQSANHLHHRGDEVECWSSARETIAAACFSCSGQRQHFTIVYCITLYNCLKHCFLPEILLCSSSVENPWLSKILDFTWIGHPRYKFLQKFVAPDWPVACCIMPAFTVVPWGIFNYFLPLHNYFLPAIGEWFQW